MFERGYCGLCGLRNFFSRIMTILFAEVIARKQVVNFTDDVILQAKTKKDMWKNLNLISNACDYQDWKLPQTKPDSF